jgi:DNA modification methylase
VLEINKIYNMDCLIGMKSVPDKSINMILSDLPFEITENAWDKIIPLVPMWEQFKRIITDNGAIVLMACQPFASELILSNKKLFRYEFAWKMKHPRNFLNANRMPLRSHINIPVFYKKLPVYNPQKTFGHKPVNKYCKHSSDGSNYGKTKINTEGGGQTSRYPTTVIDIKYKAIKDRIHSTQKPVELLEWLIKTYTVPGQLVLDCAMGAGTTAVACWNTGRDYIGYELDSDIFQKAIKRVDKDTRQIPIYEVR